MSLRTNFYFSQYSAELYVRVHNIIHTGDVLRFGGRGGVKWIRVGDRAGGYNLTFRSNRAGRVHLTVTRRVIEERKKKKKRKKEKGEKRKKGPRGRARVYTARKVSTHIHIHRAFIKTSTKTCEKLIISKSFPPRARVSDVIFAAIFPERYNIYLFYFFYTFFLFFFFFTYFLLASGLRTVSYTRTCRPIHRS